VGKYDRVAPVKAKPFLPSAGGFRSKNQALLTFWPLFWDFLALFRSADEVAYPLLNSRNDSTRT
jgi:hypothetical protein